jgi:hypothetical protein
MQRAIVFLALLAAGCASYSGWGLKPGSSTDADVRATMGEPAFEIVEAGGARRLAYPRGPMGLETFFARIGPSGALESIEQVLDESHFRLIQRGVHTREDVRSLIGPPWRMLEFARKGQTAWDYRFQDAWGYLAEFSVMFDRGGVVAEMTTVRQDTKDRSD